MEKDQALTHWIRKLIYELLSIFPELTSGEVARELGLRHVMVSQHLGVLRDAGLVKIRVDGNKRIYSIDHEGFFEVFGWYGKIMRNIATNHRGRTSPPSSPETEPTAGETGWNSSSEPSSGPTRASTADRDDAGSSHES